MWIVLVLQWMVVAVVVRARGGQEAWKKREVLDILKILGADVRMNGTLSTISSKISKFAGKKKASPEKKQARTTSSVSF